MGKTYSPQLMAETRRVDAGADKDAAAYYVRAMEKSQEKGDWFKRLGFRD